MTLKWQKLKGTVLHWRECHYNSLRSQNKMNLVIYLREATTHYLTTTVLVQSNYLNYALKWALQFWLKTKKSLFSHLICLFIFFTLLRILRSSFTRILMKMKVQKVFITFSLAFLTLQDFWESLLDFYSFSLLFASIWQYSW